MPAICKKPNHVRQDRTVARPSARGLGHEKRGAAAVSGKGQSKPVQLRDLADVSTTVTRLAKLQATANRRTQPIVQYKAPTRAQLEELTEATTRLTRIKKDYSAKKPVIEDAFRQRGGYADELGYVRQAMEGQVQAECARLENEFAELRELAGRGRSNAAALASFVKRVNALDKSGGMNRFNNLYNSVDRSLRSEERNSTNQFTEYDEIYFRDYISKSRGKKKVYRGDGRGVTQTSFDTLPFADMPAGGSPDITFAGVVEHTHTNTLKNGMVSTTTDFDTALHFATSKQTYGVVWELELTEFIDVAALLKARNFKYRFPDQYEVLAPGSIPASKIKSAKLYEKKKFEKKRTP